jgi:hypothetical protein
MTRINVLDPADLSAPHLLAEYREIMRVFGLASAANKRSFWTQPPSYRMGAGHVKFFFDKLGWIEKRHKALVEELRVRGYSPMIEDPAGAWRLVIPENLWNDWEPNDLDRETNWLRLVERDPKHYRRRPWQ